MSAIVDVVDDLADHIEEVVAESLLEVTPVEIATRIVTELRAREELE